MVMIKDKGSGQVYYLAVYLSKWVLFGMDLNKDMSYTSLYTIDMNHDIFVKENAFS